MSRRLYELVGEDPARKFSPYCWRARLALLHKGLEFESVPWRFTERDVIEFTGQKLVPVLVDGEKVLCESQPIADYLEDAYPDRPSLFGAAEARAMTQFVRRWSDGVLQAAMVKVLAPDIFGVIHPKDRGYFRESREAKLGMTLEALAGQRETHLKGFQAALAPVRAVVKGQGFLCGEKPLYADHILFGALMWGVKTSPAPLLEAGDAVAAWMERVAGVYGVEL